MTITLLPICCECGDCVVDRPGDRCLECEQFLAESRRSGWSYDRHRDDYEQFMETADA